MESNEDADQIKPNLKWKKPTADHCSNVKVFAEVVKPNPVACTHVHLQISLATSIHTHSVENKIKL